MDPSEKGIFVLVNVAAQRARQLMQGAVPLIRSSSRKPAAIAIKEVEAGLIPFYVIEEQLLPLEEEPDELEEAPPETEEPTE